MNRSVGEKADRELVQRGSRRVVSSPLERGILVFVARQSAKWICSARNIALLVWPYSSNHNRIAFPLRARHRPLSDVRRTDPAN
jgi:hypothetical protein